MQRLPQIVFITPAHGSVVIISKPNETNKLNCNRKDQTETLKKTLLSEDQVLIRSQLLQTYFTFTAPATFAA